MERAVYAWQGCGTNMLQLRCQGGHTEMVLAAAVFNSNTVLERPRLACFAGSTLLTDWAACAWPQPTTRYRGNASLGTHGKLPHNVLHTST